jgi:hypothetical protein
MTGLRVNWDEDKAVLIRDHRDCGCVQDPIFCGAFAEACPGRVARDEARWEAARADVEETCRVVRRVMVSSVWRSRSSSTCCIGTSCFFFRRNEIFTVERRQWMVAELEDAFVGRGRVEVEAEAKE